MASSSIVLLNEAPLVAYEIAPGVDLREPPRNWLRSSLDIAPAECAPQQAATRVSAPPELAAGGWTSKSDIPFEGDAAMLSHSEFLGVADVCAPVEALKALFRAPLTVTPLSLMLYRLENTLLLDGVPPDVAGFVEQSEKRRHADSRRGRGRGRAALLREAARAHLLTNAESNSEAAIILEEARPREPTVNEKELTSKFLYRSVLPPEHAPAVGDASTDLSLNLDRSFVVSVAASTEGAETLVLSSPPYTELRASVLHASLAAPDALSVPGAPSSADTDSRESKAESVTPLHLSLLHAAALRSAAAAPAPLQPTVQSSASMPQRAAPRKFRHTTFMELNDVRLVVGSDLLAFRQRTSGSSKRDKLVSLHLRDGRAPFTQAECLELWLDNRLAGVPDAAICTHDGARVTGYRVVPTSEVPRLSTPPLPSQAFEQQAMALLQFLRNSTRNGGTYWLHRAEGDPTIRLFDMKATGDETAWSYNMASLAFRHATQLRQRCREAEVSGHAALRHMRSLRRRLLRQSAVILDGLAGRKDAGDAVFASKESRSDAFCDDHVESYGALRATVHGELAEAYEEVSSTLTRDDEDDVAKPPPPRLIPDDAAPTAATAALQAANSCAHHALCAVCLHRQLVVSAMMAPAGDADHATALQDIVQSSADALLEQTQRLVRIGSHMAACLVEDTASTAEMGARVLHDIVTACEDTFAKVVSRGLALIHTPGSEIPCTWWSWLGADCMSHLALSIATVLTSCLRAERHRSKRRDSAEASRDIIAAAWTIMRSLNLQELLKEWWAGGSASPVQQRAFVSRTAATTTRDRGTPFSSLGVATPNLDGTPSDAVVLQTLVGLIVVCYSAHISRPPSSVGGVSNVQATLRRYGDALNWLGQLHSTSVLMTADRDVLHGLPAAVACFAHAVDAFRACGDASNEALGKCNTAHALRQLGHTALAARGAACVYVQLKAGDTVWTSEVPQQAWELLQKALRISVEARAALLPQTDTVEVTDCHNKVRESVAMSALLLGVSLGQRATAAARADEVLTQLDSKVLEDLEATAGMHDDVVLLLLQVAHDAYKDVGNTAQVAASLYQLAQHHARRLAALPAAAEAAAAVSDAFSRAAIAYRSLAATTSVTDALPLLPLLVDWSNSASTPHNGLQILWQQGAQVLETFRNIPRHMRPVIEEDLRAGLRKVYDCACGWLRTGIRVNGPDADSYRAAYRIALATTPDAPSIVIELLQRIAVPS